MSVWSRQINHLFGIRCKLPGRCPRIPSMTLHSTSIQHVRQRAPLPSYVTHESHLSATQISMTLLWTSWRTKTFRLGSIKYLLWESSLLMVKNIPLLVFSWMVVPLCGLRLPLIKWRQCPMVTDGKHGRTISGAYLKSLHLDQVRSWLSYSFRDTDFGHRWHCFTCASTNQVLLKLFGHPTGRPEHRTSPTLICSVTHAQRLIFYLRKGAKWHLRYCRNLSNCQEPVVLYYKFKHFHVIVTDQIMGKCCTHKSNTSIDK